LGHMIRRELFRILPVAAMAVFSLEGSTPAQTEITVKLTNQFGKPVENGMVILDFVGDRKAAKFGAHQKLHWEVRSNMQGSTHFPSINQGKVRVQVIAQGYQTYGEVFDIQETEKLIEVKLLPPQKQYSVHGDMPTSKPADGTEKPKDPPPPQ
jgi:hypothetical protein